LPFSFYHFIITGLIFEIDWSNPLCYKYKLARFLLLSRLRVQKRNEKSYQNVQEMEMSDEGEGRVSGLQFWKKGGCFRFTKRLIQKWRRVLFKWNI